MMYSQCLPVPQRKLTRSPPFPDGDIAEKEPSTGAKTEETPEKFSPVPVVIPALIPTNTPSTLVTDVEEEVPPPESLKKVVQEPQVEVSKILSPENIIDSQALNRTPPTYPRELDSINSAEAKSPLHGWEIRIQRLSVVLLCMVCAIFVLLCILEKLYPNYNHGVYRYLS